MAQAIKRYQVPIEQLILSNNGIKHQEITLMLSCLEKHYDKVSILAIQSNRIGVKGAEALAGCLKHMKTLTRLDLSHDEIGDQGIKEIVTALDTCSSNLEELDLSGNGIGKDVSMSS